MGQRVEQGRTIIPVALTLSLAKLAPGAYTLEVRVAGGAREASARRAAFQVK